MSDGDQQATRSDPRTPALVELVDPSLSTEVARLNALRLRHHLTADTRLLTARAPGVLAQLFQQLERLR